MNSYWTFHLIFAFVITALALIVSKIEKTIKSKNNIESISNKDENNDNPIIDNSIKKSVINEIKTKESGDIESLQEAYDVLNHKPDLIPGLTKQMPINTPKEEVILDEKEIPWELKNDEKEDGN